MIAKERNTTADIVEEYSAVKYMNLACYCKDKADHDTNIAKSKLKK